MRHQHRVHTGTLSGGSRSSLPQTEIHLPDSIELASTPSRSSPSAEQQNANTLACRDIQKSRLPVFVFVCYSLFPTPYSLLSTRYHGICPASPLHYQQNSRGEPSS
jgi:hypothetical protein